LSAWAGIAALVALPALATAGGKEDFDEAVRLMNRDDILQAGIIARKAADAGYGPAQALFAELADDAEEMELAISFYQKAADQNEPGGFYGLGKLHAEGRGLPQDNAKAQMYIKKAAELGHKHAINVTAENFWNGSLGINRDDPKNQEEGLEWLKKSAANDNVFALKALTDIYRKGMWGQAVDNKAADEWEKKLKKAQGLIERKKKKR
jgi:enhanced entry protein LpnE